MMQPALAIGGSGGGSPGAPGKSVELRTTETAIQWRQTGGEWADLVLLADITGTDGLDGKSVELRKTETAIQWRAGADGVWVDLVLLEDLRGPPGEGDSGIQYGNNVVDLGPVRMAWGYADSILGTPESFLFPSEFATPPVVQITRGSPGSALVPQAITKTGFTVSRGNPLPNPIPFLWQATGLKPDPTVVPPSRFDVPGLPIWSAAVRAQRAGKRNARVLCVGDSITGGHGAYVVGMGSNARAGSYPTALCSLLTARGSVASWSSVIGNGNVADKDALIAYDNRITTLGDWDFASGLQGSTLGGYAIRGLLDTSRLTFAPTNQVDTFELYHLQRNTTAGQGWMLGINSVDQFPATATWDNSDPANLGMTKVTAPLGTNRLNLRALQNGGVFFAGIVAYNSAVKEVSVLNAGWGGAMAADINNSRMAYSPIPAISVFNPDLVIIELGVNDYNRPDPTTRTIWMGHIQGIISAAVASGADVAIMIPNEISGTYAAGSVVTKGYIAELAAANNIRVIDVPAKIGNYAAANAAGYMRDAIHPNATGYAQIAAAVADVIMPVGA